MSLINITCDQFFHYIIIIADSKSGIGYAIYGIWNIHGKRKYDPAVGIACNIAGNNRLASFIHIQKDPLYIWGISVPPCSSYKITVLIKHIKILILPGIFASGKVIPESFHIFSIIQVLQIIAPVRKGIPVVLDKHSKGFVYLLISRQQMLGIFLIDTFFDKIVVKNNPEKKKKCQNSSGQYKQFGCFLHKYGNLLQCWCFSCWFSGFLLMFLGLISEYKYIIFWEFLEFFSIVEKE